MALDQPHVKMQFSKKNQDLNLSSREKHSEALKSAVRNLNNRTVTNTPKEGAAQSIPA